MSVFDECELTYTTNLFGPLDRISREELTSMDRWVLITHLAGMWTTRSEKWILTDIYLEPMGDELCVIWMVRSRPNIPVCVDAPTINVPTKSTESRALIFDSCVQAPIKSLYRNRALDFD
jgi:hypothetical protein